MKYYLQFCLLVSLFPWVSFGVLSGDIQPYSYILCSIAIVIAWKYCGIPQVLLALVALGSVVVAIADINYSFLSFRGVVNYSSPLI